MVPTGGHESQRWKQPRLDQVAALIGIRVDWIVEWGGPKEALVFIGGISEFDGSDYSAVCVGDPKGILHQSKLNLKKIFSKRI